MRGGFEILLSSFPSDRCLCSDISILSNFSVPRPDHLQKVPRRAAHSPSVRVQCASAFSEEIGMKGGLCLRRAHHCPPLLAPCTSPPGQTEEAAGSPWAFSPGNRRALLELLEAACNRLSFRILRTVFVMQQGCVAARTVPLTYHLWSRGKMNRAPRTATGTHGTILRC